MHRQASIYLLSAPVTVSTNFGHVQNAIMHLSEARTIARSNLLMIPDQFENVELNEGAIMHSIPSLFMYI